VADAVRSNVADPSWNKTKHGDTPAKGGAGRALA